MGSVKNIGEDAKFIKLKKSAVCKHRRLEFMMWEAFYTYDRRIGEVDYSDGGPELKQITCLDCDKTWDDHDVEWYEMKELFYQKVV